MWTLDCAKERRWRCKITDREFDSAPLSPDGHGGEGLRNVLRKRAKPRASQDAGIPSRRPAASRSVLPSGRFGNRCGTVYASNACVSRKPTSERVNWMRQLARTIAWLHLQTARIFLPQNEQKRVYHLGIVQPTGSGICVVQDVRTTMPFCDVVTGSVQNVAGEKCRAACFE